MDNLIWKRAKARGDEAERGHVEFCKLVFADAVVQARDLRPWNRVALDPAVQRANEMLRRAVHLHTLRCEEIKARNPELAERLYRETHGYVMAAECVVDLDDESPEDAPVALAAVG